ncbi:MAG: hypothetical protein K6F76_01705 [Clostridiales bacterium]|nr:hypothetical protein [Clostridiales bacterium]
MENRLTPYDDRNCPIYDKIIDGELCYETALCMQGQFVISSVPETVDIKISLEKAREICQKCEYANME